DWHKHPLCLTVEEIEQPLKVLEAFFDCYHLPQARACLKEWLDNSLQAEDVNGARMLFVHDSINKLMEAAWLILRRKHFSEPLTGGTDHNAMIALLVTAMAPERIYLLSKSPMDLLIIMPDKSQRPFSEYERLIEMAGMNQEDFYFSLHSSAELHKQLQKGHILYSISCTPDNLIYDNGVAPELPLTAIRLEELRKEAEWRFTPGFQKATAFLSAANQQYASGEREMTAFMLHQATELVLRALILSLTGQDIRTHEIKQLLKNCQRCAPSLKSIFLNGKEQEERLLHVLESSYKNARYSNQFKISEEDLKRLMQLITLLLENAEQVFAEKMTELMQHERIKS
ncbi:MAG TPA: HEPN domain-containing protein, partial [Flavisolibacter sp.]